MKNHEKVWLDFCQFLSNKAGNDLTKYYFYQLICGWLANNINSFGDELWKLYNFKVYIEYDPSDYPIESSDNRVQNTIDRVCNLKPSSIDAIAMIVRDLLWDMVAYKSDIECPNCGDDDFRVLYDIKHKQIVLSCDLCGWSQFEDGKNWQGDNCLVPAKVSELKASSYLE